MEMTRKGGVEVIIAAINAAAKGAFTATYAQPIPDRQLGGHWVRLDLRGHLSSGHPFNLVSLPVNGSSDLAAIAVSMVSSATAYFDVVTSAGPTIKEALLTAKTQGVPTKFDSLMARLDTIADGALKPIEDAMNRFEESAKQRAGAIAQTIDTARVRFEDKVNRISNAGPPLDDSPTSSPPSDGSLNGGSTLHKDDATA